MTADDRLAASALEARGALVSPAVWTDASVDWDAFDLVVIRSPWDWQEDAARFADLLARLDASGRVENRSAGRWLDKRYLLDLASRGARVVPTHVVPVDALGRMVAECKYERAVIKPPLGAGGKRTVRFEATELPGAASLAEVQSDGVVLLQPYVEEVVSDGEWSLVFFEGEFSHALKKRAPAGEFRVQEEYGGTVEPATPPADVLADAKRVIAAAGERFLYARVDGIVSNRFGGFCLNELEVVEPELFFRIDPGAPARFAHAVMKRLRST